MASRKQELLLTGNYIYMYHLDEFIKLPTFPDNIVDSSQATYSQTPVLGRSAPYFTYSYSGPRAITFQFMMHRDLLDEVNSSGMSNAKLEVGEDYTDALIRKIQAIALPTYEASAKAVNPPMVAVRIGAGEDIFIKGVVSGTVSIGYSGPILSNGRYALINITFTVYEIDPYDARTVSQIGSFRGITKTFKSENYD